MVVIYKEESFREKILETETWMPMRMLLLKKVVMTPLMFT
jgi:hypothetical protein